MDYNFFVKPCASISQISIDKILEWCIESTPHQHDGFKRPVKQIKPIDLSVLANITSQLEFLLPAHTITGAEVIVLQPSEEVVEHSDMSGIKHDHMWNAAHHHKIIVPLSNNPRCFSYHRRTLKRPLTASHLKIKYAWLYNDYVWHSGKNLGASVRYQLSISYLDSTMSFLNAMNILTPMEIN